MSATIIVAFMKGDEERRAMMAATFPSLFTPEVVTELAAATEMIVASDAQARDTLATARAVQEDFIVPSAANGGMSAASVATLSAADAHSSDSSAASPVTDPSAMPDAFERYAEVLSKLIEENGGLPSFDEEEEEEEQDDWNGMKTSEKLQMVLPAIAEFCGAEATLGSVERTCRLWRATLGHQDTANPTWLAIVQGEDKEVFPRLVAQRGASAVVALSWREVALEIVRQRHAK